MNFITMFSLITISLSLIFWVITIILIIKSSVFKKDTYLEELLNEQIRHNKINEENFYNLNKFLREKKKN